MDSLGANLSVSSLFRVGNTKPHSVSLLINEFAKIWVEMNRRFMLIELSKKLNITLVIYLIIINTFGKYSHFIIKRNKLKNRSSYESILKKYKWNNFNIVILLKN